MANSIRRIGSGLCGLGLALALVGAAPALGGPYPNAPNQPVSPSGGPTGGVSGAGAGGATMQVASPEAAAGAQQSLPFTGGDVVEIVAIGLGAAAAGAAAVHLARSRRRHPEAQID